MDKSPEILNESKHVDLIKNINLIVKKLKEIQGVVINPKTGFLDGLLEIISFFNENLEDNFGKLKSVNIQHKVEALQKIPAGVLCVNVNEALKKIGNQTSLATIMRGLLDPTEFREVQENALLLAEEALEEFESDIEILLILIKRGGISKSVLKKSKRLKILKDHFEEFVSAKGRLEDIE